ncbi:MAG: two-component system sensor histidine kinase [Rhodobacteraceae bacterium]|nr:MAG: two-component system sensor histidine kinase [Paracoccaceae bacterium]
MKPTKLPALRLPDIRLAQILVWVGLLLTVLLIWASTIFLTDRFTTEQREKSRQRADLFASTISATLQRNAYVPLLLSRDQTLTYSLITGDYTATSARLVSFKEDLSAASIILMDINGLVVAATDPRDIFVKEELPGFFIRALREDATVFQALRIDGKVNGFYYARKIEFEDESIGVIVVEVDLQRQENFWRRSGANVVLSDSSGNILLASHSAWRDTSLQDLLKSTYRPTTSERLFGNESEAPQSFVYINGERLLVSAASVGFLGWDLSYFASLEDAQARVNAFIALELMILAMLAALIFYLISRKTTRQSTEIQAESAELRRLNKRLSSEIEQRQRAEQMLETAEQSLEQASKLAALGQMSASVSHELNQPLAAMRTYLAGARLLLQRNRAEEALISFQRIDDLIERMGAITKQLKSHATKASGVAIKVDLRDSVASAMSMMAPQLGQTQVNIVRNFADQPALVVGDPVRIEQIIVNLLRNALDAVKPVEDKRIEITLKVDDAVTLTVQDNGTGIEDASALFEPFATTKKPGEGVGLGLAISAGFASDMNGKLTGRNATPVGAIFELQLPRAAAQ